MDYWDTVRFALLERAYLAPPEPRAYEGEEEIFLKKAELRYESIKEGLAFHGQIKIAPRGPGGKDIPDYCVKNLWGR